MEPRIDVRVRHSADCPDSEKGKYWRRCNCRKVLYIYEGGGPGSGKIRSAHTRSWEKAEQAAQKILDRHDPVKRELAELKAVKERASVTIEKAVGFYLQDLITRLGDGGTAERHRTLFGYVDAHGKVARNGRLFDWLEKQPDRPILISDMTQQHLQSFRDSWKFASDLTTASSWTNVKTFFKYCKSMGWINANPAAELRRPQVKKGNRTATFSDAQYDAILAAAHGNQRLETFLELMRWSGMALVDVVEFNPKLMDGEGVLRYKRKKTDTLATVKLPEHVQALLRSVPLDANNKPEQPFLRHGVDIETAVQDWRKALQALFALAGVAKVKTDVRTRPSHPHMLRDTCAVWYLRHGMSLYGVAKILGHSNPTITARAYLPFVTELEKAHIAENQEILAAASRPKQASRVLRINRNKS